jgi:hydroxymethylpyrimidine/phosphomethylpyrimidine kinase
MQQNNALEVRKRNRKGMRVEAWRAERLSAAARSRCSATPVVFSAQLAHAHPACTSLPCVHDRFVTAIALSIAGSDPSGGAGIQADLKTFHAHAVYGMGVISLLTVQNSHGVRRVSQVAPQLLAEQIDALFEDTLPTVVKTGALGSAAHVEVIADRLGRVGRLLGAGGNLPLIVDPVLLSKNGSVLLDAAGSGALQRSLFPLATLVTPNLDEARLLLGRPIRDPDDIANAARALCELGARAVLLKGGHRHGDPIDVLCSAGQLHELHAERVHTQHTHGVGCTLSAAIAARLALGHDLLDACVLAKRWLTRALASAVAIGGGQAGVNHLEPLPELRATSTGRAS